MVYKQEDVAHNGSAWCFMHQTSHAEAIHEMPGQLPKSNLHCD